MRAKIDLWLASAQHLAWALQQQHLLDAAEASRWHALSGKSPAQGRAYVLSRVLRRTALTTLTGVPPQNWSFPPNALGQPIPQWRSPTGILSVPQNLGVSLAHCQDLVVVAVGEGCAVGVDIEHAGRFDGCAQRVAHLAGRLLTPLEQQCLAKMPEAGRPLAFLQRWALKEAAVKALGQGLRGPWRQLAPSLQPGSLPPDACRWSDGPLRLPDGFVPLVDAPLWCALWGPPPDVDAVIALCASGTEPPHVHYKGLHTTAS